MAEALPNFDLILATVDRVDELERLFDSLERQTHTAFRLIVVDQNDDDRVGEALGRRAFDAVNVGLAHATADVVAFPDDDCVYPDDLLERVAGRFSADPSLAGLAGREVDTDGRSSPSWKADAVVLTDDNLWNRAISFTIFLRRETVAAVGEFDEQLGLGSGKPWSSGEEIDYLVRAVRSGARIAYEPSVTVTHRDKAPTSEERHALAYRDGASVGYVLRKNGYSRRVVGRMLARPLGGALLALVRFEGSRARVHVQTLRGRIAGLRT